MHALHNGSTLNPDIHQIHQNINSKLSSFSNLLANQSIRSISNPGKSIFTVVLSFLKFKRLFLSFKKSFSLSVTLEPFALH
jgi:hypothetical protein